jgi:hypothetical protein
LMATLERKVKPERIKKPGSYSKQWWLFGRRNQAGTAATAGCKRVLVVARTSRSLAFAATMGCNVFSENLIVFAISSVRTGLTQLQTQIHDIWVRQYSSSFKDDLGYRPTDCFETFPFPSALLDFVINDPAHDATRRSLEAIGERYHQFRAELMISNNEGLTSTYNRFHDPAETSSDLLELRRIHGEMDQAVLAAYGWSDVPTGCGFGLDYLDLEEDAQLPDELQERIDSGDLFFWDAGDALVFQGQLQAHGAITGRRKLPWRYRWPDSVRDDVLARLLALNAERYAEEVAMGLHSKGGKKAAHAAGTDGRKRPGRPLKASQPGEAESAQAEQMGLRL